MIQIYVVCTDQDNGRYLAFDPTDPTKHGVGGSEETAVVECLKRMGKLNVTVLPIVSEGN